MLRFGDDLTEELLQYLSLEDKIRLECVSKQWQRCVYQRQFVIEIHTNNRPHNDERLSNVQLFQSLLKKCPNIRRIDLYWHIDQKSEVLSLIGRYCPRLKSLFYQCLDNDIYALQFFREYGHKLEELDLEMDSINFPEMCEQIFRHCPNVKKVKLPDNLYHFPDDKEILPKLEEIKNYFEICSEDVNQMKILSDKYSQTMKTLDIALYNLTEKELKTCIDCIAQFENLKKLTLHLDNFRTTEPFNNYLKLIGQNCTKLLKLDLHIDKSVPITKNFFSLRVFSEFKAIKKLDIYLNHDKFLYRSVECFQHCKQLNKLKISYPYLTEHFFADIDIFIPGLRTLLITTEQYFSESFVDSFQLIKNFKRVNLNVTENFTSVYHESRRFIKSLTKTKCEFNDWIYVNGCSQ